MWASSRFKYSSVISIFLAFVLTIPIVIDLDGFHILEIRNAENDSKDRLDIFELEPSEKSMSSPSWRRGTRSLEAEYLSLVDYNDVLIVRNNNSVISMEIADYFKEKRNIPNLNVCNISTSTGETISRANFNSQIRTPIENYLINNGLLGTINYIVTTKGVPLRISEANSSNDDWSQPSTIDRASVDSELTIILGSYSGYIGGGGFMMPSPFTYEQNPYYNSYNGFSQSIYNIFLVARLTGFNVTQIKAYIDKVPEAVGKKGVFVFDVDPGRDGGSYQIGNDRMRTANATLTAKGFDVILDETNTFLTNYENVSGYTSWGSNDGNYPTNSLLNPGFETDANGDDVPDNWYYLNDTGVGSCTRNDTDFRTGSWSVNVTRNATNGNATYIAQNYTIKPDTRYYAVGYANLSGVSPDYGAHLQIRAYDSLGNIAKYFNGSARTGTTASWVTLYQLKYEPQDGIMNISVGAVLSESSGTVFFDDIRLYEIKPHNSWLPGALVETYVSTSGRTFNYPATYGQSLAADLILDGVSGTKAYVYEPYLSACAHPDILFDAYTNGYYSAESYYMASEFLSWMDVVVCDPKLAIYKRNMIPDIAISPVDITFSENEPVDGDIIDIYANVHNIGNYTASDVTVRFYLGDPQSGGILIGESLIDIAAHDQNLTSITWNTTGFFGIQDIYVFVDAEDRVYELSETNNIAFVQIPVCVTYGMALSPGWNLISLPLIQTNSSILSVLDSINGEYDAVYTYETENPDLWKLHHTSKPPFMVDLFNLNHTMGIWIKITNSSGTTLILKGLLPTTSEGITLYPGWNLVGYPSLTSYNRTDGLNNLIFDTHVDSIWTYNATSGRWAEIGIFDNFESGRGYWIHSIASGKIVWNVPV